MLLSKLSNALWRYEQRAVANPLSMIVMFAIVFFAFCIGAIAVGFPPALAAGCTLVLLVAHAFAIALGWCVESLQHTLQRRNAP